MNTHRSAGAASRDAVPAVAASTGAAPHGRLGRLKRWCQHVIGDLVGAVSGGDGGVRLAPAVPVRQVLARFWPWARPHRALLALSMTLSVTTALLAAISIGFFKILVDQVLVPRDLRAFWWVALAYLGLTLVGGVVGFARRTVSALAGERFILDLRRSVFDRVQLLSLAFFERQQLGDVIARMTGDIKSIERLVVSGVAQALGYVLRIVFFTAALFYLQWQLALASLVTLPVFGLVSRRLSAKIKAATREQTRRSGALSAVVEESLANIPLVQAYNRQDAEAARLEEQNVARFRARMAATRLRATFAPLVDLVELTGTLVVAGLGTWMLARGELTLGGLLAFAAYLTQLYSPIRRLGQLVNTAFAASAGAERVIELLDQRPEVTDRRHARELVRCLGELRVEHLDFTYPHARTPALRDVSFVARPGEVVALVGASGAGKSTLVKLLLRFYEPTDGHLCADGADLRDLTVRSWRQHVAVVLQETLVFDGTIWDNIAYGRSNATDEEVLRAARAADVHDFATALPDGYRTVIGQRGRRLSGGQRQRVAIARAMVRNAPVLILDEPTTGLDSASTHRVLEPMRRLMADRTTLLISHDLTTTRVADRIVVLDGGEVVDVADHETLLSRCDTYRDLYQSRVRWPQGSSSTTEGARDVDLVLR